MPRFYDIFVCANNLSPSSQKPMPITINNYLPSICLYFSLIVDEENKTKMLLDTSAAVNFGNLSYHFWLRPEHPEMVGEFFQYGDNTGYDVVQLIATLDPDWNKQPLDRGKMTAFIRYRTPYLDNNRNPLFIFFALSNNVSLRCVIWLPTQLSQSGLIDLVKGTFFYSELNRTFPLILDPPGRGLPDGVVFDNTILTILVEVFTNIRPDPSLLHYTFSEGRALSNFFISYSDQIIVHDKCPRGNISCDLEHVPRWIIVREGGLTTETNSIEHPQLHSS